ncbi:MAG: hypothetical protein KF757_02635 [Phycisphaeraceae bacterium]|nr:hypothetical protein [Phycisphaeraceae bacterium]MCW5762108.1 hypothetical protein [Phycisphaeraceae bacterium]
MRKSRLVLGCVLGTLALSPVGTALSQQGSTAQAAEVEWDGLVNVTFGGGTLAEFVRVIQKSADPVAVNVVLRGNAGQVELPSVTLRRVTVEAAFEAICSDLVFSLHVVHSGGEPIIVIEERLQPTSTPAQAQMRAVEMAAARNGQDQRALLRVYPVRELVESGTVTYPTILDALRVALEAEGSEPKAEIMHHEASGVLIVRGTPQHEVVTRLVLDAIRTDLVGARHSQETLMKQRASTEQALRAAEIQVRRAEINENAATRRMMMVQDVQEQGFATDQEIFDAELSLEHARLARLEAEGMLRAEQVKLERIQSQTQEKGHPIGGAGNPSVTTEWEIQFKTRHPDTIAGLFTALNQFLAATGGRGTIDVIEVKRSNDAAGRSATVRFRGDAGAMKVFPELCKHVRELDQSGQ